MNEEDQDEPIEINDKDVFNPDDVDLKMDEKTALSQGKAKLSVCTGTVTAVGSRCDNYRIGDTIMVACTAQVSCPINGRRKLIFSNGCWVKANRLKDCHWAWV